MRPGQCFSARALAALAVAVSVTVGLGACGYPRPPDVGDDAGASCTRDLDCGAAAPFCVDRTCAVCKTSASCPVAHPVCDLTSHDCRHCSQDGECDSGACDLGAGTCVDQSAILYAAPGGLAADPCTRSAPCSLLRASAVVDASHSYIVLLPGVHKDGGHFTGGTATICGGGATLDAMFANVVLNNRTFLAVRGLKIVEGASVTGFGAGSVFVVDNDSDLTLDSVDIRLTAVHAIEGGHAITVRNTTITNGPIVTSAQVTVDRSTFLPGAVIEVFGTDQHLAITNSVFISVTGQRAVSINGVPGSRDAGTASIVNNTFVGGSVGCSGNLIYDKNFHSNIFYSVTTLQNEPGCSYNYNLISPAISVGGTGNTTGNPLFVDIASNDLHLRAGSAAIDIGDPVLPNGHDRDGLPRPVNGRSDAGAFEYRP